MIGDNSGMSNIEVNKLFPEQTKNFLIVRPLQMVGQLLKQGLDWSDSLPLNISSIWYMIFYT